jgi:glycerophosphoryl diester phosphodiesterase
MCTVPVRVLSLLLMLSAIQSAAPRPLIIGHRGASGHRPEHTLEGYRLAAQMGADFIEPDLVPTGDGVLIARHENEIGGTTDVSEKFPDRRRTRTVDGQTVTGWFAEDFTLAEIRTLRARERLPFRSHAYDGQFSVPTFDEVIELAQRLGQELGRPIGVYPETKHPTYFRGIGLPVEDRLLEALQKHGWNRRAAPVFIQSFEPGNLRMLRGKTTVRLVQLVDERRTAALDQAGLKDIAAYADVVAVTKGLVIPVNANGTLKEPTDLVTRAHDAGLLVHIWTLRADPQFLPAAYHGSAGDEFKQFAALGVDGIFTDFPDVGFRALRGTAAGKQ